MEANILSIIMLQVFRRPPTIINISVAKCMKIHAKLYTSVVSKLQLMGHIHMFL